MKTIEEKENNYCKHYNTTYYPRYDQYRCRDCGDWDVNPKNDRYKDPNNNYYKNKTNDR